MELKELNHAGEQGVFGSLRVLGDIDSKNLKLIKRDVNKVQNQQYNLNTKIDDYWASLSDDGIITAGEKKALKSEWDTIQQTFAALLAQATAKALVSTSYWQAYQDAYDDLKELLYVTEKVFNDMYIDTTLTDKDNWNDIFKAYYYQEQFVQVAIMTGLIDKLGLRVLDSLEDPGVEGELAFYKGELYQYTDGAWCRVGTESYLGIRTELPEASEENQYFLAGDIIEFLDDLVINDEVLYINDDVLGIKRLTRYGYMYYWNGTNWFNVPDEDPRYLAVLADYMTLNGVLPYVLEVRITQVAEDTVRNPNKTPKYLGPSNTIPVGASKQDYFLYTGITAGDWVKNHIYRYNGEAWQHLNPSNDGNSRYYMTALQDILTLEEAGDGYFSSLFCDAFFTNKASINALKVQTIYLYDTGVIQSEQQTYVPGSTGLLIDSSGNIDANGDTHLGANTSNKVAIGVPLTDSDFGTYNTVIGGNVKIKGNTTFNGKIESSVIHCGSFHITSQQMSFMLLSYSSGTDILLLWNTLHNIGFDSTERTVSSVFNTYDTVLMTYGSTNITTIRLEHNTSGWRNDWTIYFNNGAIILFYEDDVIDPQVTAYQTYIEGKKNIDLALKLIDIPAARPIESNIVYRDGNNLKIS